jgi:hypothetical protein
MCLARQTWLWMLVHEPPSPQVPDKTPLVAAVQEPTDPSHFQETVAAASAETDPLDFQDAAEQNSCPKLQHLITGGSSLKVDFQVIQGHRLPGDTSTGVWRPLVPVPPMHHRVVFQHIHGIAHPSRLVTRWIISSRFVWPGLSKDTAWAKECAACRQSKIHCHFQVRLEPIPLTQRRFALIHINLVGPLTPSNGFNHILTVIDRTSRCMEALPLANTKGAEVAAALFSGWYCRFGVPTTITSDSGAQFTSNIWNSLCLLLQIKHQPITA